MESKMDDYRKHLVSAAQKSIEFFDKTLISLAGGSLALSIVFVQDIIGDKPIEARRFIIVAWCCWLVSLAVTLSSYYTSYRALTKAIDQVDANQSDSRSVGGLWTKLTDRLNLVSAGAFLIGVLFMVLFAAANLR